MTKIILKQSLQNVYNIMTDEWICHSSGRIMCSKLTQKSSHTWETDKGEHITSYKHIHNFKNKEIACPG